MNYISNHKIFYMHIPKTAGSSFNNFLASRYGNKFIDHIENRPEWLDPENDILLDMDCISGHIRFPDYFKRRKAHHDCRITFVRDPVEHIISHLAWVRRLAEPEHHAAFKRLPTGLKKVVQNIKSYNLSNPEQLSEFFETAGSQERTLFNNCQTRYFSGTGMGLEITKEIMNEAKKNFDKFDFIGITDLYHESLLLLCEKVNWNPPLQMKRMNVFKEKFGIDKRNSELVDILKSWVTYDMEIYGMALSKINLMMKEFLGKTEWNRNYKSVI